MESAAAKLELGLERLAKARDDADLLGLALQSIHGALEDHFRARLAADPHVPVDQQSAMLDPKRVQWRDLLDAMQLYADLSPQDREQIWRMNAVRTKVAHGGRYAGGRAELERYAALAQSLLGHTTSPKPARPAEQGARAPATRPTTTAAQPRAPVAGDDIPRAVRAGRSRAAQPAPAARSRAGWLLVLLALALLFGLASFVALRGAALSRTSATAVPPATVAPPAETAIAAGQSAATTGPAGPRAAVVTPAEGLNLRADHTLEASVIVLLPSNARVTILDGPVAGQGHQWWQVEFDGQRGWCAGEFLKFE